MFSNLSASIKESIINYPTSDSKLPFLDYIATCRSIIESHRPDLEDDNLAKIIIEANTPYELMPVKPITHGQRMKYGVLLIHGLQDCPFSLKDIGLFLQDKGILCRSVLLPGHGTSPQDLFNTSYHSWIQTVRYGIESLKRDVEDIYLIGYSTGATLSIYHALQDQHIGGIILLAPAISIKAPIDLVANWKYLVRLLTERKHWIYRGNEIDYAKYKSIAFNPVHQVSQLTHVIRELQQNHRLDCRIFMAVSREDETISSEHAINFFSSLPNRESKLLLYTSMDHKYPDPRIITRSSTYPELGIKHFSHSSLPFSPNNTHYGREGDYRYASTSEQFLYGAYNRIEEQFYKLLHHARVIKMGRRELTFNPDFDHMASEITQFIIQ